VLTFPPPIPGVVGVVEMGFPGFCAPFLASAPKGVHGNADCMGYGAPCGDGAGRRGVDGVVVAVVVVVVVVVFVHVDTRSAFKGLQHSIDFKPNLDGRLELPVSAVTQGLERFRGEVVRFHSSSFYKVFAMSAATSGWVASCLVLDASWAEARCRVAASDRRSASRCLWRRRAPTAECPVKPGAGRHRGLQLRPTG